MSLINEALKKAQKQRTGETPPLSSIPSIGGEPAARIARREKPVGFNSLMVRLGAIAAGLLIIILGTIFTLRLVNPSEATPAAPAPSTTIAKAKSSPASVAPAKSSDHTFKVPGVNAPATAPASTNPPAITPASTPIVENQSMPVETAPTVAPAPANPPIRLAPGPARMDNKSVSYIEGLRIAGIRASATDSKVLMNDRVYRAGDIVEHELGLKLVTITPNSLTFENETGARYTRSF